MSSNFGSYLNIINKKEGNEGKSVKNIQFNVIANKYIGDVNITDIQLQAGNIKTLYHPNVKELLERTKFGIDEYEFLNTVDNGIKIGVQPRKLKGLTNRLYNIMGRGHEVVSTPNVYHEDYGIKFCTTNLDITLVPKNDYDLLRISTNEGAYIEGRAYDGEDKSDNPLNIRYSREFFFPQGRAGDIIKLTGSDYTATVNGIKLPIKKGNVVPDTKISNTQRFMVAPSGTFRTRIEFYKKVDGVYKDVGIGFNGVMEFNQNKEGGKF